MQASNIKALKPLFDNRENVNFDDNGNMLDSESGKQIDYSKAQSPYKR